MSFDADLDGRETAAADPDRPLTAGVIGIEADRGDAVVTRSAEELRIYTRRRETQRVRLVKYVEAETVTRTVEVRHEHVRMTSEPVAESPGGEPASPRTPGEGGVQWLVLYDEEVVVQTRWVPRERVRLSTFLVTEDLEISEDLRTEQIAIDETHGG